MTNSAIAERLGGKRVFDQRIRSDLELVEVLREGFPAEAVDALLSEGTITQQELYALVIPRRTLALRRQRQQRLTPEESDRLARLARVLGFAEETFGSTEKVGRWLRKPNRGLGGQVPIDLLSTEAGARVVEQSLGRIVHGIFA
jgi:putative toxin-antitoxin system antitoxin component (TIGR02293 family)